MSSSTALESQDLAAPAVLRCEYLADPLGVDVFVPRFSWQVTARRRGMRQVAYQLLVASTLDNLLAEAGDLWDSGKVASAQSAHIAYDGMPLASRQRCYWAVRLWDAADQPTPFSEPAVFEMALLDQEDWTGQWIAGEPGAENPLLRQTFRIDKPVIRARVYVCGLGYYELRLNGRKVGDRVLDPNWTDYDERDLRDLLYPYDDKGAKRALYAVYDVVDRLRPGDNVVGVMLGNGWYNQRRRTIEGRLWYGQPRLLLQLELLYGDGTRDAVVSDGQWRWHPGPLLENQLFSGEVCDARRDQPGWDRPGFDAAHWATACTVPAPSGERRAQLSPADKVHATLPPVSRLEPRPGCHVFDFGQNLTGWVRLQATGDAGTRVTLRFAEELDADGMPDFRSAGGADQIQEDVYVLRGGAPESYEPRFTWHGFRYVQLDGYPGTPGDDAVAARVVHAAVESAGSFACSEPLFVQLNEVYRRTQLANYHGSVPSDCPHRERLGYTGDGHLTVESALCNFRVERLYLKWLDDIADAQNHVTGFVPHTAPFCGGGGGPAWGSAIVLVTWQLFLHTGDRHIVKSHYKGMTRWLAYLAAHSDADGLLTSEEPGSWCLGDWSLPDHMALPGKTRLEPALVNTAYHAICARLLARMAAALGRQADAALYARRADEVAAALHRRYFDAARGCYAHGAHGAEAFAWAAGAIPDAELPRVVQHVCRHLRERAAHFDTGILGTPLLLEMLSATGHIDLACRLMTRTDFPSFGWMLARGATTLWENWNEDQGSHCHPMYGSYSAWFYRAVAGLRPDPDAPGYERVLVRPGLPRSLTAAAATVETLRGPCAVAWQRDTARTRLALTVPAGSEADVLLPLAPATLRESDREIWTPGQGLLSPGNGVATVAPEDCGVRIRTGGGSFRFEMEHAAEAVPACP